jgi:hypothetical protein
MAVRSNLEVTADARLFVATTSDRSVDVLESDDRAATWSRVGAVSVDAVDPLAGLVLAVHGSRIVVLAQEQSSSAFTFARIAASADRGQSWAIANAPSGGAISAASGSFWLVGGVSGDRIYQSSDGLTWEVVEAPLKAADWTAGQVVEATAFGAVVPITIHDRDRASTVAFFGTTDGGRSWRALGLTSSASSASGTSLPINVAPDGRWIVVDPDGSSVRSGVLGEQRVNTVNQVSLPSNVTSVLINGDTVTVSATPGSCPDGKSSCFSTIALLQSVDGGTTWTQLD